MEGLTAGVKGADCKDVKLQSKAVVHLGPLPEQCSWSKKPKVKVGPQATEMVATMVHGVASLKEAATLLLSKEQRTWPPKVTEGIPSGYEETAASMDDDPAEVWEQVALGILRHLSKKGYKVQATCGGARLAQKSGSC